MWYASAHSNFYKDGNHYFGVQSFGYKTKKQEKDSVYVDGGLDDYYNAHLIKFDTNSPSKCIFSYELSRSDLATSLIESSGEEFIYSENAFRFSDAQ